MYEETGDRWSRISLIPMKKPPARFFGRQSAITCLFLLWTGPTGNKYTNVHNEDLLLNQLLGYVINQAQKSGKMLESTDQYQMLQAQDPWNETGIPGDVGKF